jgi:hypothetical protein
MPGASWEPAVLCTGCVSKNADGQFNAGLPTFPYGPPFSDFVGRIVDSTTTGDLQGGGMRTVRARIVRIAPSLNRIYIQLGSTIAAYSLDTFFSGKLLEPMVALNTIWTGQQYGGRDPFETLAKPDAFFYAEHVDSGWQLLSSDGQDRLYDFDFDDRGYLYIATGLYGMGIQQDDGRVDGTHLPFIWQNLSDQSDVVFSMKIENTYYIVRSRFDYDQSTMAISNVTNPSSPVSLSSRSGPQHAFRSWAKNENAGHVALRNEDNHVRVYTYAALVAGTAPLVDLAPSSGKRFADLAFDESGNLWVAEASSALTSNVLWKLTPNASTYDQTTFDVYGGNFSPLQLDAAGGWIAVAGSVANPYTTEVRLLKVNESGAPVLQDTNNFFRSYYHRAPLGYAQVKYYAATKEIRIVVQGAKTYLIYNVDSLGDVYQFDDGKPIINSVTPLTGPPAGSTTVKVYGKNFGNTPALAFDGTLTGSTPNGETELDAETPAHAPGGVDIVVTAGPDSATAPQQFTYALAAPQNLVATATSATEVSATWDSVESATQYELQRQEPDLSWTPVGTTASLTLNDPGRTTNTTYVYRVRALDASAYSSPTSTTDFATTASFAGQTIAVGTPIEAQLLESTRTAVNALRSKAGLTSMSFTEAVATGAPIRAQHFNELRTAVAEARTTLGATPISFTDASLTGLPVKAIHIQELMNAVQ